MNSRVHNPRFLTDNMYEICDTIFFQGNGSSQTQILKYTGNQTIVATTGEHMECTGRNHLKPLYVIYRPFIGVEIADVNLSPFKTFNVVNYGAAVFTRYANYYYGNKIDSTKYSSVNESVRCHAPIFSECSIGQETDMASHRRKYEKWLQQPGRTKGLILWGVSRGTAATFCAFAKEKYSNVRLVILEGAIDSVEAILPRRVLNTVKFDTLAKPLTSVIQKGLQHSKYRANGPSPLDCIADFPSNVPVVFVTSKADHTVPSQNTENIALALAKRGQNDVYLLTLERSSHPNYMFDDKDDHDRYETFIHAIYKKYHLQHDAVLAKQGEALLPISTLFEVCPQIDSVNGVGPRIKTVYYERSLHIPITFDELYNKGLNHGGGMFYVNPLPIIKRRLPFLKKITLLQYDIPEAKQELIYRLYQNTHRLNDGDLVFSPSSYVRANELVNFANYVGHWEYTLTTETGDFTAQFHPCDLEEKQAFILKRKIGELDRQLPKKMQDMKQQTRAAILIAILYGMLELFYQHSDSSLSLPLRVAMLVGLFSALCKAQSSLYASAGTLHAKQHLLSTHSLFTAQMMDKSHLEAPSCTMIQHHNAFANN